MRPVNLGKQVDGHCCPALSRAGTEACELQVSRRPAQEHSAGVTLDSPFVCLVAGSKAEALVVFWTVGFWTVQVQKDVLEVRTFCT